LALTLWGQLVPSDGLSLAIVGSRRATRYGLEMAARLAGELAWAGLTIVSGLARGIDGAAHRGALEKQGRTIAILGSGLGNIYPSEHRRLAERIAENGAVLSEFATGEPPRARNFPRRNRILTGMTLGTIVVEAALKSGSLISARHALEQNREVFAVPGPARAENSAGVHGLIRDGATLVTDARDVVEELRPEIRKLLRERCPAAASAPPELDEHERAVFTELRRAQSAVDVDALLERVEMPTERALSALCGLEVKGHIWRLGSGLYQVKP
jgi:DNA processing protein